MHREILKDKFLQNTLNERGYVVIPGFLDDLQVNRLSEAYGEVAPAVRPGFHVSNFLENRTHRLSLSKIISDVVGVKAKAITEGYRPLLGLMYVKEPGVAEKFYFHLDVNVVDEKEYDSLSIWIPLVDIDEKNGAMQMLRGSHREELRLRGSPMFFHPSYDEDELKSKYPIDTLQLKKGDAVIWTHRLFHGSLGNFTNQPRIAASLIMIPEEALPLHLYKNDSGQIEIYK